MEKNSEIEVSIDLKPTKGEPSPAWRRLASKLFKKRGEPAGTRQDASDGEMRNENDTNVPNL